MSPSSSVINDVASGHGWVKYRACANLEGFFVVLQTSTKSSHATVLKETVYSFTPSQFLLPPFLIVKSELLTEVALHVDLHWWCM